MKNVGKKYCRAGQGHRRKHNAYAFHSGHLRLQTHTRTVDYALLFHCNNGCTKAHQCYTPFAVDFTARFPILSVSSVVDKFGHP